jgi:hypothetical protein
LQDTSECFLIISRVQVIQIDCIHLRFADGDHDVVILENVLSSSPTSNCIVVD